MFFDKPIKTMLSSRYRIFTERSVNRLVKTAVNPTYYQQRRYLDLQEYQSKQILHQNGVNVQRFKVVESEKDIKQVLYPKRYGDLQKNKWSGFEEDVSNVDEFVIKAQILAGGRGKGRFVNSGLNGGVKMTNDKNEAEHYAKSMLNDYLITKQTKSDGVLVRKVMIAEAVRLTREFYLAIVFDRSYELGPIIVASPMGGMDIEEVASENDSAIRRFTIPIDMVVDFETAQKIAMAAFDLDPHESNIINQCANEIIRLHNLFLKLDATQIEINPLGVTEKGQVLSVDAKMKFDENARFRQKWLDELEEMNVDEVESREALAHKHNLNYIGLDGNIGCLVNGAGLAMATMDLIKLHGGEPANFLDVGGGATVEQVTNAFRIITSDPNVNVILVNIFGGIMRCDIIAEGIIAAAKILDLRVPIVCRLQGTAAEEAMKSLKSSDINIITCNDFDEAAKMSVLTGKSTRH